MINNLNLLSYFFNFTKIIITKKYVKVVLNLHTGVAKLVNIINIITKTRVKIISFSGGFIRLITDFSLFDNKALIKRSSIFVTRKAPRSTNILINNPNIVEIILSVPLFETNRVAIFAVEDTDNIIDGIDTKNPVIITTAEYTLLYMSKPLTVLRLGLYMTKLNNFKVLPSAIEVPDKPEKNDSSTKINDNIK